MQTGAPYLEHQCDQLPSSSPWLELCWWSVSWVWRIFSGSGRRAMLSMNSSTPSKMSLAQSCNRGERTWVLRSQWKGPSCLAEFWLQKCKSQRRKMSAQNGYNQNGFCPSPTLPGLNTQENRLLFYPRKCFIGFIVFENLRKPFKLQALMEFSSQPRAKI